MRWQALFVAWAVLIVVNPSEGRYFGDVQRRSPLGMDGFGNLFVFDDSTEDTEDFVPQRQTSGFPSFPFYIPSFRPTFIDQLQASLMSFQKQLMQQISTLTHSLTPAGNPTFSKLPDNYKNSTSTTKVVNGSVVTVNETIHKVVNNGASSFFHIKVVSVQPENETVNATNARPPAPQQLESNEIPVVEGLTPNLSALPAPEESAAPVANAGAVSTAESDTENSPQPTTVGQTQAPSESSTPSTNPSSPATQDVSTTERELPVAN